MLNGENNIQNKLAGSSKDTKMKTELLIEHAMNKSEAISPQIFDVLEFVPQSPNRNSKLILHILLSNFRLKHQ